jgi:hypothetical protein
MEPNKGIQAEDSPKAEEPKKVEPVSVSTPVVKKGFIDRAVPWVLVALIFLIGGAAIVFFTLYQPKVLELKSAQADLKTASENLASSEIDLSAAKADALALQTALSEKTTSLTQSDQMMLIYKFQADLNATRVALLNHDPSSARQALNFVTTDLVNLKGTDLDTAALSGFESRLAEAERYLLTEPQKSLDALNTLNTNLLLLLNNL